MASYHKLEVGKIFNPTVPFCDYDLVYHDPQPFFIIREVTYEDWFKSFTIPPLESNESKESHIRDGIKYYYEVSTD